MTCEFCEDAMRRPLIAGRGDETCDECVASRLPRSPQAFLAVSGQENQFPDEIKRALPKVEYDVARQMVWRWIERQRAARSKPP